MIEEIKVKRPILAWFGVVAVIIGIAALLFWATGCADKKTFQHIQQVLPVIEKPCPKPLCLHGDKCEPCEKDGDD